MRTRAVVSTGILGDELGPRGRRRVLVATVVSAVLIGGMVAIGVARIAEKGQFRSSLWRPLTQWSVVRFLLGGMGNTLKAAFVAIVLALLVGIVMALGRLARNRVLRWLAGTYVEFFRAVPLLLLIFYCFFGLPTQGIHPSAFQALVLGLTVYNGAVLGEIIRAGVLSLDAGQGEAAVSLGLSSRQAMRFVILPQAARRMAPAIVSQLVTTLKDTALGVVIGFDDALSRAGTTGSFFGNVLQAYVFVAVCYIVANLVLSRLAHRLEVRQQRRLGAGRIDVTGVEDLAVIGAVASADP